VPLHRELSARAADPVLDGMTKKRVPSQSDADALQRKKIRDSKPVREWTTAERCEAFREGCRIERERAEADIVEEWELCESCHEYKYESDSTYCKRCIERAREYEQ